jgi:uncharacterized membrane protein YdbT with pleckstrin-like domain
MDKTVNNYKIKIFKSPFILFLRIILLILFIAILDFISFLSFDFMRIPRPQNAILSYEEFYFLGSLFIQFILVIYLFLQWGSDYFYFEQNKLLHKTGIILKKTNSYDLSRIDNILFRKKIFGTVFNYVDITLFFGNQEFKLKNISNPYEFTSIIERYNKESTEQKS